MSRRDKAGYAACCKAKGCGYGYVSALVFGKAEYASAEEASGGGKVDFAVASAGGQVGLRTLHRRSVRGGVAAVIAVTEGAKESLNALGLPADSGIEETSLSQAVKEVYEANKITVTNGSFPGVWSPGKLGFAFVDGGGHLLTENEFVRRYQSVTTSSELSAFDRRRNSVSLGLFAASLASLGGGGLLMYTGSRMLDDLNTKGRGTVYFVGGGVLALTGFLGSIFGGVSAFSQGRDGELTDHDLSDREARNFVDRYNRVLLRRTVVDVRKNQGTAPRAPVAVRPLLAPGVAGLGLGGSF